MSNIRAKADLTGAIVRRLLQVGIALIVQAAILFIAAGRLDWLAAWAWIGLYLGMIVTLLLILLPKNPELVAERGQVKEDTNAIRATSG